jgi:hypothetical protein
MYLDAAKTRKKKVSYLSRVGQATLDMRLAGPVVGLLHTTTYLPI